MRTRFGQENHLLQGAFGGIALPIQRTTAQYAELRWTESRESSLCLSLLRGTFATERQHVADFAASLNNTVADEREVQFKVLGWKTDVEAERIGTVDHSISHTGLDTQLGSNPSIAGMMRPRLIGKEQAKTVASAGGAIGVWTHLADTPLEYPKNVRALVDVVGSITCASARIPSSPSPADGPAVPGAQRRPWAPVNKVDAPENAPIRHGGIKQPGSTTLLSMRG